MSEREPVDEARLKEIEVRASDKGIMSHQWAFDAQDAVLDLCAALRDERAKIVALEAKVVALRKALKVIASGENTSSNDLLGATYAELEVAQIARVALAQARESSLAAPSDGPAHKHTKGEACGCENA